MSSRTLRTLPACALFALLSLPAHATEIRWDNPGTGDWFDASNWDPAQVPVGFGGGTAGDDAFINNGGTAEVGPTAPLQPRARTINVGANGTAPSTGTLAVQGPIPGGTVAVAFGMDVGVSSGAAGNATGTVQIEGADLDASGTFVDIGRLTDAAGPTEVLGVLDVNGNVESAAITAGTIAFSTTDPDPSPAGLSATAVIDVSGNVVGGVTLATNFRGAPDSSVSGTFTIGGNLDPRGRDIVVGQTVGTFLDDTVGPGTASGTLTIGGAISLDDPINGGSFPTDITIGDARGTGSATGSLSAAAIATNGFMLGDIVVGRAVNEGIANGALSIGSGNVDIEGDVVTGLTQSGFAAGDTGVPQATGSIDMAGSVITTTGANAEVVVGQARSAGFRFDDPGEGEAQGSLDVAGLAGFQRIYVGSTLGFVQQPTMTGHGTANIGAAGIVGTGDSQLFVGATLGSTLNGQMIGEGGTANGAAVVAGDVTGQALIGVGLAQGASNPNAGFGDATGSLEVGGNVSTRQLSVGYAQNLVGGFVVAPDARLRADGSFAMTGGTLEVQNGWVVGGAITSAAGSEPPLQDPVVVIGRVNLTDVTVTGDALARIGSALGFDGDVVADGDVTVTGGSMQVRSLNIGGTSSGDTARGLLTLTDSELTVNENASIGNGNGASDGTLTALRSDVTVGGDLGINAFGSIGVTSVGLLDITGATLTVGGNVTAGAGFGFGDGAGRIVLTNADADIGGFLRIGGSANLGALTAAGEVELTQSNVAVGSFALLDTGALQLTDSRLTTGERFSTTFFNSTDYFPDASGDSTLALTRSILDVGDEFHISGGDTLRIVLDGTLRATEYGAIDAASATLLGGILEVDIDFALTADSYAFDLIVASALDSIVGDFDVTSIIDLDPLYAATFGIVSDTIGGTLRDVYRLSLVRPPAGVPEPGTLVLMLTAGLLIGLRRRV